MRRALAELHQALAVADPGGGAVEHRGVELFGNVTPDKKDPYAAAEELVREYIESIKEY